MATDATTYTVLELVTRASRRLGLPAPTSLIGSTDELTLQLLDIIDEIGEDLVSRTAWPQLMRETSITLVADQEDYALPGDFESFVDDTNWDRTNEWKTSFPISPKEWQWRKNGITDVTPWRHLRVRGAGNGQLLVHPPRS